MHEHTDWLSPPCASEEFLLGSWKGVALLWKKASHFLPSLGKRDKGDRTFCLFSLPPEKAVLGKGSSHTILVVCALKVLLNQIRKTFGNMMTTGESSPYSSLVIMKILHFHNICYSHPLQCTLSSLCPINPLFVQNKLRPRKGLALNHAPSPHHTQIIQNWWMLVSLCGGEGEQEWGLVNKLEEISFFSNNQESQFDCL